MPRFKFTIEYHGGPFVGWQRQDNGASVQGALEDALRALGENTPVQGAGRTDAGVHALGQAAHADTQRRWEPHKLRDALNHHLKPAPIAVLQVDPAADDFHARFSAIERSYIYRITARRAPLALEKGLSWRIAHALDADAMQKGARYLIGKHDFTTFRASQCQAASPIKSVDEIRVERASEDIRIFVRARSFLHNQVRSFVGTLERVGAGKWSPEDVKEALDAQDRARCGPVAPAHGLYLDKVTYP